MSNRRWNMDRRYPDRPLKRNDGRLGTNLSPGRRQRQRLIGLRFVGKRNAADAAEAIDVSVQDDVLDSLGRN